MKISMGPGKGKKKTAVIQKTFDSPSGRDSDNTVMVKNGNKWVKK